MKSICFFALSYKISYANRQKETAQSGRSALFLFSEEAAPEAFRNPQACRPERREVIQMEYLK